VTNADGSTGVPVTLVVPAGPPPGQDKPLPRTGFELVPVLLLALVLVASGVLLLTAVRRRTGRRTAST